jgi:flagellar motor switch protein FliG
LDPRFVDDPSDLSGVRKAAVLLIALGVETASEVLRHMDEREVEAVSIEIARTENVAPEVIEAVFAEYREMNLAREYISHGGTKFAREALVQAIGRDRAEDLMMRIEAATEVSAFQQLQTVDTEQLSGFIQHEHPQTAALIFAHINPRKAAEVLDRLSEDLRSEVMFRLASMDKTSPEFVDDVEAVLQEKLDAVFGTNLSRTGGEEVAAEILNSVSRTIERRVYGDIRSRAPDLADRIRNLMFVFDDLVYLEDRDMQRLLTDVEQKDLALALKGVSKDLEEKIMNNLSSRVAEMIAEEVDLLGRVRVRDVDEAQSNIMEVARDLEEQEEISRARDSTEYIT